MIPLKPEHCRAAYEMLCSFPPFCRWNLPNVSEVRFHVSKADQWHARWYIEGDRHHIEISGKKHHYLHSLLMTMAHELVHVHQRNKGSETKAEHNAEFKRLASQVCKQLGFDPGQF